MANNPIEAYILKNKKYFLNIDSALGQCSEFFYKYLTKQGKTDQNLLISLFLGAYFKELQTVMVSFQKGLLTTIPLLLKKIIEAWRYLIYYSVYDAEASLLLNNVEGYKKPRQCNLSIKIDEIITEKKMHRLLDESSKFYQDFMKDFYERVCSYSHMDILPLKAEMLDKDMKLDLGINVREAVLKEYLLLFLILIALFFEFIAYYYKIENFEYSDIYKAIFSNIKEIAGVE